MNDKCPHCGEDLPDVKWSWNKFFIGKLSNQFIAFVFASIMVWVALFSGLINGDHTTVVIIVWGASLVMFVLYGAIYKAVSNAQIKLEMQAKKELGGR